MNKRTLIEKIKMLFNETPAETEVKFVDVKTQDGKILRTDSIEAGMKIVEIDETGEVTLENGTYVLEDGTSLVVEDGLIKEVVPAAEEEMENEFDQETVEIINKATEQFASILAEVKAIKEAFAAEKVEKEALKTELGKVQESFASVEKANKELAEKVEKFGKAPSADSTKTVIDAKKATREEKLREFSKR